MSPASSRSRRNSSVSCQRRTTPLLALSSVMATSRQGGLMIAVSVSSATCDVVADTRTAITAIAAEHWAPLGDRVRRSTAWATRFRAPLAGRRPRLSTMSALDPATGSPQAPMGRSGPASQYQPWVRGHNRRVLLPVLAMVALAVPGLVVLGVVTGDIGLAAVLVGTTAAVVPVVPVVAAFLWVDRWEPEPSRLLLLAFLWGAGVSVLGAAIVNDTAATIGDEVLGIGGGDFLSTVVSAPIVEEAFKGTFLVALLLLRRREFDGVIDGIVYAGMVAAGFAFTENILYFGRAFATDGLAGEGGGILAVFVLRGVLSPFAHPVFTAMIGIAVGVAARRASGAAGTVGLAAAGYLGAVVLHALWNGSAGLGYLIPVYLVIMLPLFAGLVALVGAQRRREQRVVAAQLPGFASAGWIAPSEVGLLASLAGRRGWRRAVRRRLGDDAADAVRDYQAAVTELAFLRDRMVRGTVGPEAGQWHDEVLGGLMTARGRAVNAPDALGVACRRRRPADWSPPPVALQPGAPALPQPPGDPTRYHRPTGSDVLR